MSAITRAPARPEEPAEEVEEARAEIERTRERLFVQLAAFEKSVPTLPDWRAVARKYPLLTLGGAFLTGWAFAKLVTRRSHDR